MGSPAGQLGPLFGVTTAAVARPRPRERPLLYRLRRLAPAYALVAPAVLASVVLLYIPIMFSGYWSFTEYNGLVAPKWVGLANYTALLHDSAFRRSLLNTFIFVLIGMGIGPVLGLLSALLLNRTVRFRAF